MEFTTRTEARKQGLSFYFDGEECSKGHLSDKYTSSGKCVECIEEQHEHNKTEWEDYSNKKVKKKEDAKKALKYIRETLEELNESEKTGLLTNYTVRSEDLDILPRDRKSAEILGEKFYDTGLPCKNNHKSKRHTDTGQCIACIRQYSEEYRPYAKVYANERRAREKNAEGFFSKEDVDLLLLEQGYKCVYCPAEFEDTGYHIDHVIPLVKGGSNWPDNLQLLCPPCNLKKSGKMPEQYEKEIGFIRDV